MQHLGTRPAILLVGALALCLGACKRSDTAAAAQVPTGALVRPAPAQQGPAAMSTPVPTPSSPVPVPTPAATAAADLGAPAKLIATDSAENFTIAGHTFRMLKHSQRVERPPGANSDATVEWWELRNSKDQVIYRETYPVNVVDGGFDFVVSVTATPFTTKEGAGIVVQRYEEPSAPLAGGSVQVFGYKYGRDKYGVDEGLFQSFGPPIWVDGEYLGVDTEQSRPTPNLPPGVTMTTMDDILKFKLWTGNFFVMYPVRINWITGSLEPRWRCMEMTSKGRSGRCSFPVDVEAHRGGEPTFVRLFPEADDGFTAKHVILQPDTKVEYLEARLQIDWSSQDGKSVGFSVNGDAWLKVRIGGQEGWVHSQEDFDALGVPQSD